MRIYQLKQQTRRLERRHARRPQLELGANHQSKIPFKHRWGITLDSFALHDSHGPIINQALSGTALIDSSASFIWRSTTAVQLFYQQLVDSNIISNIEADTHGRDPIPCHLESEIPAATMVFGSISYVLSSESLVMKEKGKCFGAVGVDDGWALPPRPVPRRCQLRDEGELYLPRLIISHYSQKYN
jgi:hypothetical protein